MTNKELRYLIQRIKENKYLTRDETNYIIKALEQEPCEDAISRQIISDYVQSHIQEINTGYGDLNKHTNEILRMIVDYIEKMESVTLQPKTGHWIADIDKWGDVVTTVNGYRCDKCNVFNTDKDNYCPNCGAKMVEPQESEE